MPNPYFRDAAGNSTTREAVIRLISATGGPVSLPDGSSLPASAVLEPSVPTPSALYDNPSKDIAVTYVGRAAKQYASGNPDEETWCIMADISKACARLSPTQMSVIAYRYVYDYIDSSICSALNLTLAEVADAERLGLDKLVALLDETNE